MAKTDVTNELAAALARPVRREVIGDQVTRRILDLVQQGVLRTGQKLPPERELADKLGVGRPSLREALRALSVLGVLDIRQGDGVFVSALDPASLLGPLQFVISLDSENLEALFEARILIEGGITGLAAKALTTEHLQRLDALIEQGEDALGRVPEFLELDVEFHRIILVSVGNPFLESIATSLQILGKASREITGRFRTVREQAHRDHVEIVKQLAVRDAEAAMAAMQAHLKNVRRAYSEHQRER